MLINPWIKAIDRRKVSGKYRTIIIDDEEKVINENPTKDDLKGLPKYLAFITEITKLPKEKCRRYLVEFIRHWVRKNGNVPEEKDFYKNPKYPSFTLYWKIFESWNYAIRESGFIPKRGQGLSLTEEELLEKLIQWYEEHDEPPTILSFRYNTKYPHSNTYDRLGGWKLSLKILGFDTDSLVRRGIIRTVQQKGKLGVIFVVDCYKEIKGMKDLTEEDYDSPYDIISSEGTGDVKTSKFYISENRWFFSLRNENIYQIKYFYLLAFNEDFTELMYAWKIPNNDDFKDEINNGSIRISNLSFYIENMKPYEITDKIWPIFEQWLENIKKQDNSKDVIVRDAKERLRKYIENKKKNKGIYDKRNYDGYYEEQILEINL